MAASYPDFSNTFIPAPTGEVFDPLEVPGALEMLLGEHAEQMRALLKKPRPINRYVQIVKGSELMEAKQSEIDQLNKQTRRVAERERLVNDGEALRVRDLTPLTAAEVSRLAKEDPNEWVPPKQAEAAIDAEREAIAQLVETAMDARDLHEIAARIRARKGQTG